MDRTRLCARPGCGAVAAATLSYRYATRTAWIDDLTATPDPAGHDLCPAHADGLRVPRGWTCEDRRAGRGVAPSAVA
jgi:hypothetical protein